jgi:alkanesulfonate monooxygenase SsuD/methylene tetrahydromethanopterin reductase-like flavin-dependent oxidoreductase (luciferase family)
VERYLAQAARADELGFDWISVSEHHYAPIQMTPNCLVMAAALSQRTQRAKIALLGPLVPLCNPVRLAEEIAMLDMLSGGRVVVLFLRGTPNEHKTYDTPAAATRGMTQEGIQLILKAWQERAPFAWHGEHYRFDTVSVWPRVYQQPHPAVFGSGNSDESVRFAAAHRIGIAFSFAPPEAVRDWVAMYHREARGHGWTPSAGHVVYRGLTHVAATDAAARGDMEAHFGARAAIEARFAQQTLGGPPVVPLILEPYFVGSPATVRARCAALRDIGVGVVDLAFVIGGPKEQAQAVELFASDVLPELQRWEREDAGSDVLELAV